MQLRELLAPWHTDSLPDCKIHGLQNDSRKIQPGDLFIAYPGALADGRLFIDVAVQKGAVAIIYDGQNLPENFHLPKNIPTLPFNGLINPLSSLARRFFHYEKNKTKVIGITGTNGKTTIAYQLAQAHNLLGQKAVYLGTIGQGLPDALSPLENTTPDALCLQALLHSYDKAAVKEVCMEVSSHALSLQRVDGINFYQAIFTNLTHDHLDFHSNMDDYGAAKASLFAKSSLKWAIINHDDPYAELMKSALKPETKCLTYGLNEGCSVRAVDWNMDIKGTKFEVASPWGRHKIHFNALGKFNIYNALAVFSSLLASGYSAENIVEIMPQLKEAPGRMEIVSQKPCVIVDYAHTPDALQNVLSTLSDLKEKKLWVIFGCGGDRDKTKRPLMGKAAEMYADEIIITSDNPRSESPESIMEDIEKGLTTNNQIKKISNRKEAIHYALKNADPADIILIAGKGHESYQQIGKEKFNFSDQAVVKDLIL